MYGVLCSSNKRNIRNRRYFDMAKDLTTGKITPQLITFTIPLVLGNIFQLTYNAVDSIIVGNFVGKGALAAVGICNPITTLFILLLNGLCLGASILMGNQYGAKNYDKLHRQISTTMISGTVFSLLLSIICIIFARPLLSLMQVDPQIMDMTVNRLPARTWNWLKMNETVLSGVEPFRQQEIPEGNAFREENQKCPHRRDLHPPYSYHSKVLSLEIRRLQFALPNTLRPYRNELKRATANLLFSQLQRYIRYFLQCRRRENRILLPLPSYQGKNPYTFALNLQ